MILKLQQKQPELKGTVRITGSKSESNRLLLLQALFGNFEIKNLSNSEDSDMMQQALASTEKTVDIHHAGTAMRFLTAYFAAYEGRETLLTGSSRMQERPIGLLVNALNSLGADISYVKNEGFAPLLIKGKKLEQNKVALEANVSSQYISALMMVGASMPNGIEIELIGKITSVPYIEMTRSLLTQLGIESTFEGQIITIKPVTSVEVKEMVVESDWSSASYYYSLAALCDSAELKLSSYKKNSLQGDSALAEIYTELGVETTFLENEILLKKTKAPKSKRVSFDLANSPDIAQTIAVTCYGLGIGCELTGLHTLKIKETDRLEALKAELTKLCAEITVTNDSLHLKPGTNYQGDVIIKTYQDHRMAMAFAPMALRVPIVFEDAEVVNKSYPDYWNDLKSLGFEISEL
ncbi:MULTISPECIES: 3-phosphoshikimate 1-carboxyvinyltransferase [unclassified Leeuwenhoekiella]|uniref:3-phosphoshikimate 1-carboxyvinyltransferase n=1 Tax=unclassified Leeuwenhoekiella TaxID=2615029 RepID=UPI000C3CD236|nr:MULTISPECIES: 3-phosphoshikimate 1-carboxyvinyltransferase [unclassified Leeuwenhoekiella]MAW96477.1 3-phosphoshikimate 1-carboxyvinyltransferase [Leeuwenhoekiella sp.]MBA81364.1 3-phosphoshikimate 1-carboxyvinyltransferase [Leeuwenhoekiella sp.]